MDSDPQALGSTVPLARRADVKLGSALIRPSTRTIEGPDGTAIAEPRVMQVLMALFDAGGTVLSREDLLQICWGARIVGDDAINRAIAEARRISLTTGAGYVIETIPRVGYRLQAAAVQPTESADDDTAGLGAPRSRRKVLTIAVAGAAAVGAASVGWQSWRRSSRVSDLIKRGDAILNRDAGAQNAAKVYRQAIELEPGHAESWGKLSVALTMLADDSVPDPRTGAVAEAQDVAEHALALDANEPSARTSMAVLRRGLLDWTAFERELLAVLQDDPQHFQCLSYLTFFLQGIGRCRESWVFNERALKVEPMAPKCHHRRAFKHWIFGHPSDADQVSNRAFELWPRNRNVWNARVTVLAFTGRPRAAMRIVKNKANRPSLEPQAIELWTVGLEALRTRSASDVAKLRDVAFRHGVSAPGIGAIAVMLLSQLGQVEAAYQVAEGFLMSRGGLFDRPAPPQSPRGFYSNAGWRGTQWLFTPPTTPMRDDPRFTTFCAGLGYTDYWRAREIWPDKFVRGSLKVA